MGDLGRVLVDDSDDACEIHSEETARVNQPPEPGVAYRHRGARAGSSHPATGNDVALAPVAWGKWTKRITVKVRADPRTVVAWFLHPDRREETLAELVKLGMTDIFIEDSFTDTVRIRNIRYKTPKGSAVHARSESELGPDGHLGAWRGDRFVTVAHGCIKGPNTTGRQDKNWDEIREFVPTGEGITKLLVTRHEQLMNPRWDEWLLPPITERGNLKRNLRDMAMRCEEAQRTP
jgi:hypothetical protein